jgi:hypothetical protein
MLSTIASSQNIQSIKLSHLKYVTLESHILKGGKRFCGFVDTNNNAKQTIFVLFLHYLTGHVRPLRPQITAERQHTKKIYSTIGNT